MIIFKLLENKKLASTLKNNISYMSAPDAAKQIADVLDEAIQ